MPGTTSLAPAGGGPRSPGNNLMSLKKKVMAKKPPMAAGGGAAPARTSLSGAGSTVASRHHPLPKKPHSATAGGTILSRKPKKPTAEPSPKKKPLTADLILAVGTAFCGQQSASSVNQPASLEALWTLEEEVTTNTSTCTYSDEVKAQSLFLKDQDPFLPPVVKSPPSVSDLWSFEGVSNSTEPEWDPNDPLTQCINPYEAEGIKPDAFEKSKLNECSNVPIGGEKDHQSQSFPVAELKKRKKEKKVTENSPEASCTEVKEEIAEAVEATEVSAPTSFQLLSEIKSESTEPKDIVECDFEATNEPTGEGEEAVTPEAIPPGSLEAEVLKAEFIYPTEDSSGAPEDMDIFAVLDDSLPVGDFMEQMGLEAMDLDTIQPDPCFIQEAHQELRAMAAADPPPPAAVVRQQMSPVSVDSEEMSQINAMVDPAILPLLSSEEVTQVQEDPPQPTVCWQSNGGGVLILTPSPPQPAEEECEAVQPAKTDILGDLVDQLLIAPTTEPVEEAAPEIPQTANVAATVRSSQRASTRTPSSRASAQQASRQQAAPVSLVTAPRAQRLTLRDPNARYSRMRQLNNDASKRCRENRKLKLAAMLDELREQEARNEELRLKYKLLVEAKDNAKKMFLQMIAQGPAAAAARHQ